MSLIMRTIIIIIIIIIFILMPLESWTPAGQLETESANPNSLMISA